MRPIFSHALISLSRARGVHTSCRRKHSRSRPLSCVRRSTEISLQTSTHFHISQRADQHSSTCSSTRNTDKMIELSQWAKCSCVQAVLGRAANLADVCRGPLLSAAAALACAALICAPLAADASAALVLFVDAAHVVSSTLVFAALVSAARVSALVSGARLSALLCAAAVHVWCLPSCLLVSLLCCNLSCALLMCAIRVCYCSVSGACPCGSCLLQRSLAAGASVFLRLLLVYLLLLGLLDYCVCSCF